MFLIKLCEHGLSVECGYVKNTSYFQFAINHGTKINLFNED